VATRLEDAVLTDALAALSSWRGDTSAITRAVELTDEQNETVVKAVMVTADAMDHHPQVQRSAGSTSFTLSTHSEGGVTELDIMLASRIDDLVRRAAPGLADTGGAAHPPQEVVASSPAEPATTNPAAPATLKKAAPGTTGPAETAGPSAGTAGAGGPVDTATPEPADTTAANATPAGEASPGETGEDSSS
jgi:4a-hydroxytetrahydrobiopterin dehydratase